MAGGSVKLSSRYIPVYAAVYTIQPAGTRRLPDRPATRTEVRLRPETAQPERTFEGCAHAIAPVEVRREIKNGALAIARFDDPQKIAELLVEFRPRRSAAAVSRKFEIHGWRQSSGIRRHVVQEMGRLVSAASAEREEMVGPRRIPAARAARQLIENRLSKWSAPSVALI